MGDAPLFGLGRDLLQGEGSLHKACAHRKRPNLSFAFRSDRLGEGTESEFCNVVGWLVQGANMGVHRGHVPNNPSAITALFHMRDGQLGEIKRTVNMTISIN